MWTAQVWSASVRSLRSVVRLGDLPSILTVASFTDLNYVAYLEKWGKSQGARGSVGSQIALQKPLAEDITHYSWRKTADQDFSVISNDSLGRPTVVAMRSQRRFTLANEIWGGLCFTEWKYHISEFLFVFQGCVYMNPKFTKCEYTRPRPSVLAVILHILFLSILC